MKIKRFTLLRTLLGMLLMLSGMSTAWCYTNMCYPYPATHEFHFNFGTVAIKDIENNKAGTLLPNVYQWNSSGDNYKGYCDCGPSDPDRVTYFNTKTSLPNGHAKGYYKINGYLDVSTAIYLIQDKYASWGSYVQTPWSSLSNGYVEPCSSAEDPHEYATGGKGKMSFYITKAFVGITVIVDTKIVDIYASKVSGAFGPTPLASVSVAGQITAPQSCIINAGQIVTVDFGKIWSGDFTNKGKRPDNTTPQTIKVPIKCSNIAGLANLTMRIQSIPSEQTPEAIKTNNNDVGVEILDNNGNLLLPNTGLIPLQLDENAEATVTFKAVPVSTTGNTPASGQFQAQAYIRVDFA